MSDDGILTSEDADDEETLITSLEMCLDDLQTALYMGDWGKPSKDVDIEGSDETEWIASEGTSTLKVEDAVNRLEGLEDTLRELFPDYFDQ